MNRVNSAMVAATLSLSMMFTGAAYSDDSTKPVPPSTDTSSVVASAKKEAPKDPLAEFGGEKESLEIADLKEYFRGGGDNRRVFFLTGTIADIDVRNLEKKFKDISKRFPNHDLVLRINSNGGHVDAALDIWEMINKLPNPVHVVCEGNVKSGAAFLCLANIKGLTIAEPTARIMLHNARASTSGAITLETQDLRDILKSLEYKTSMMVSSLCGTTTIMLNREDRCNLISKLLLDRNLDMTAEQARALGWVDEVAYPDGFIMNGQRTGLNSLSGTGHEQLDVLHRILMPSVQQEDMPQTASRDLG